MSERATRRPFAAALSFPEALERDERRFLGKGALFEQIGVACRTRIGQAFTSMARSKSKQKLKQMRRQVRRKKKKKAIKARVAEIRKQRAQGE